MLAGFKILGKSRLLPRASVSPLTEAESEGRIKSWIQGCVEHGKMLSILKDYLWVVWKTLDLQTLGQGAESPQSPLAFTCPLGEV